MTAPLKGIALADAAAQSCKAARSRSALPSPACEPVHAPPRRAGRAAPARPQGGRRLPRRERGRHGDGVLRQGRSRPGAAHRHAPDRRRGARRSASTRSNMSRAIPRSRPTRDGPPARTASSAAACRSGRPRRRARKALIELAAQRLNAEAGRPRCHRRRGYGRRAGGAGISFAELIGERQFNLKLDPKAPLKDPATYTIRRQVAAAARCAGQMHRERPYLHAGLRVAGHAARPRDPAAGDRRQARFGRRRLRSRTLPA